MGQGFSVDCCVVTAHWGRPHGIKIFGPIIINLLATNLSPKAPRAASERKMYKTLIELLGAIKKSAPLSTFSFSPTVLSASSNN